MTIHYKQNTATLFDLDNFYLIHDEVFVPRLSSVVNINQYVKKIYENATIFEAWEQDQLVALVACYNNDSIKKEAYITSVIVDEKYQGMNIGSSLLTMCLNHLRNLNFKSVSLEVNPKNSIAIHLYKKYGFEKVGKLSENHMQKMVQRL